MLDVLVQNLDFESWVFPFQEGGIFCNDLVKERHRKCHLCPKEIPVEKMSGTCRKTDEFWYRMQFVYLWFYMISESVYDHQTQCPRVIVKEK